MNVYFFRKIAQNDTSVHQLLKKKPFMYGIGTNCNYILLMTTDDSQ